MSEEKICLEQLTPKQIVAKLDTYIVGQKKAKKAVAIALRNRTRRLKLPEDVRDPQLLLLSEKYLDIKLS